MTTFMQIRDQLRSYAAHHEVMLQRIWHLCLTLVSLWCLATAFPVEGALQSPLLVIVFSVFGMFLPISGCALVILFFGLLHLALISTVPTLIVVAFFILGYLICVYYQAETKYHLILLPVTYQLGIPFASPLVSGLLGSMNDVAGIVVGGFIAFYLKVIHDNIAILTDSSSKTTALALLMSQMLQNRMFYFFIISLVAMFLVVYLVRTRNLRFSWFFAVFFGTAAEFAIMLAGYLFTGNRSGIPALLLGNLVTLLLGILMTYFLMDLDYNRVEKVQFEDDDYYYYVTAVPKIKLSKEEKTVKKITHGRRGRK